MGTVAGSIDEARPLTFVEHSLRSSGSQSRNEAFDVSCVRSKKCPLVANFSTMTPATAQATSASPELSQEATAALRTSLRGNVLTVDDGAAFQKAGEVWNKMYQDRAPRVIVQPLGNTDVVKALKFAEDHSLDVAVKGGGHSALGHGLIDGGLVIDMSLMRGVVVDPVTKTAVIQGGATLGDIDEEMGVYDLMFPLGHYRRTGMGLILGGGLGVAARKFGVASEHLTSVTLVTAEGEVVTCSRDVEEDLFWACHGAAPNFGVVTSVTVRLHDVGPYYGGLMLLPGAHYHEVARFLSQMTYAQTQDSMTGPLDGMPPVHVYWVSNKLQGLPTDDFIQTYDELFSGAPPELAPSMLILDLQGGEGFEKPAYGPLYLSKPTMASWYAIICWTDVSDREKGIAYAKKIKETLAPFSTAQEYANMCSAEGTQSAEMVGGEESLQRLRSVKQKWDPTNKFRSNHNISI
ncbi:hypothetical protein KFL_003070010 [Klebsormidium nitens]|uniref:FAD-binding PCMH-type domain-containing protein n=1 Tax=Klebsormidium nitens TaxID=105231 RepID=A0A1Y1I862_KLENI|nr:hypothetical protein KFL_003070010 [Klebsormidium nitens]|eukprot:GAQ86713.1 hypothetical protein KFL_003070010 [Klebsormidium nitens]